MVTGLEEQKSPFMTQTPSPTTTGSTRGTRYTETGEEDKSGGQLGF